MPKKRTRPQKPAAEEQPKGVFRVLIGCNASNGDRFEVGETWPANVLTKKCREALVEMGAIELTEE